MKLSEAILLGSTVVSPEAGRQYFSETQTGCALGMAAIARGCQYGPGTVTHFDEKDRRTLGTERVWGYWVLRELERPCNCWRFRVPRTMRIKDVIAHLFDYHIVEKKNWTMEKLAAWVATVEPEALPAEAIPAPTPSALRASLIEAMAKAKELQAEAREWQSVRESFEATHKPRRQTARPGA